MTEKFCAQKVTKTTPKGYAVLACLYSPENAKLYFHRPWADQQRSPRAKGRLQGATRSQLKEGMEDPGHRVNTKWLWGFVKGMREKEQMAHRHVASSCHVCFFFFFWLCLDYYYGS